jgi:hypothetical protein
MDGDRRPAFLALAMVPLYALVMLMPNLGAFFGMRGMGNVDFGIVVVAVLIWMYVLRWVWATKSFDRFFGYAEPERSRGRS